MAGKCEQTKGFAPPMGLAWGVREKVSAAGRAGGSIKSLRDFTATMSPTRM